MENIMSNRLLTTRRGTVVVGAVAAVLAAVILLVYLSQYRNNLKQSATPVTVLVAKRLIEKNTPGDLIGRQQLFVPTTMPQSQLREGAISDPIALRGTVAIADLYPGQQLTTADFAPKGGLIVNQLARDRRAIAIPTDSIHGLVGQVATGDHVDIYVAFANERGRPSVSLLLKDALVMSAPGSAGGGRGRRTERGLRDSRNRPDRTRARVRSGLRPAVARHAPAEPERGSDPRRRRDHRFDHAQHPSADAGGALFE